MLTQERILLIPEFINRFVLVDVPCMVIDRISDLFIVKEFLMTNVNVCPLVSLLVSYNQLVMQTFYTLKEMSIDVFENEVLISTVTRIKQLFSSVLNYVLYRFRRVLL